MRTTRRRRRPPAPVTSTSDADGYVAARAGRGRERAGPAARRARPGRPPGRRCRPGAGGDLQRARAASAPSRARRCSTCSPARAPSASRRCRRGAAAATFVDRDRDGRRRHPRPTSSRTGLADRATVVRPTTPAGSRPARPTSTSPCSTRRTPRSTGWDELLGGLDADVVVRRVGPRDRPVPGGWAIVRGRSATAVRWSHRSPRRST